MGAVGGAKDCLEIGAQVRAERKQFGKPDREFGLIQQKIADMATQIYVAEAWATAPPA